MNIFLDKTFVMNTILIATDFSPASRNAAIYGVALAKAVNAKVILFNAYNVRRDIKGFNVGISRYDLMMQTDKKLLDEADDVDPGKGSIEVVCDEGIPEEAIISVAKEKKADLIIAGMKGTGKNIKKLFGSTASALIKNCEIPVLIVPENVTFRMPDVIAFASENASPANPLPQKLTELAGLLHAKLFAVTVGRKEKIFEDTAATITGSNMTDAVTDFKYVSDSDITHALNEFVKKYKAGLLAMVPHKHEWLERVLLKSETKEMIFHTHIPLLLLPSEK